MKIQKNIAANLRLIMKTEGISLRELSERTGIARSTLREYLFGATNPRADTIELLAEGLGISPAKLISDPGLDTEELERQLAQIHPQLQAMAQHIYSEIQELRRLSEWMYLQEAASESRLQRDEQWDLMEV